MRWRGETQENLWVHTLGPLNEREAKRRNAREPLGAHVRSFERAWGEEAKHVLRASVDTHSTHSCIERSAVFVPSAHVKVLCTPRTKNKEKQRLPAQVGLYLSYGYESHMENVSQYVGKRENELSEMFRNPLPFARFCARKSILLKLLKLRSPGQLIGRLSLFQECNLKRQWFKYLYVKNCMLHHVADEENRGKGRIRVFLFN